MFLSGYRFFHHVTKERIMKLIHIVAAGAAAAAVVSSAPVTGAVVAGVLLGSAALAVRNSSEIMESGSASATTPLPISGEEQRSTQPYSPTEHRLLRVIRSAGKQDLTKMGDAARLEKDTLTEEKGCLEKKVEKTGKCKYISHCKVSVRVSHEEKFKDIKPFASVSCFEKRVNNIIDYPELDKLDAGVKPNSPRRDLKFTKINLELDTEDAKVRVQNTGTKKIIFKFSEACGGDSVSLAPGETKEIPDLEEMCASKSEVEKVRRH